MKQILYLFLFASVSLFGQNTQNTISAGMAGGESPEENVEKAKVKLNQRQLSEKKELKSEHKPEHR